MFVAAESPIEAMEAMKGASAALSPQGLPEILGGGLLGGVETLDGESVIAAALAKLEGGYLVGELRELPADYGAGHNPGKRFLPGDYGEAEEQRDHFSDASPQGTIWTDEYNHRSAPTVGDIQREMPKIGNTKLKDLVRYKGPAKESKVLKQANTNAELEKAITQGDSDRVAALLRFGFTKGCVNVNAHLWPKRDTMLHRAAKNNHRDICVMLLEAKAEIDCEEISDGRHPLHDACMHGSYDVVELLLDKKARIEENTFMGMRPLHWAASSGRAEVADLLLDRQAKVNAAASNMHQPLHFAAKNGHAEVVRLLCRRGAKIDAEASGRRALHMACLAEHTSVAAVLMDFDSLGVMDEFGPKGMLAKCKESALEESMREVERLNFQLDEAEEFSDMGQDCNALEAFKAVVAGFADLGLANKAKSAHADAARCGITLEPLSS